MNDPADVKALLDSLRASQAWQNLVNTPPEQPSPHPGSGSSQTPASSASVAALLSQLNAASPSPPRPSSSNALQHQEHPPQSTTPSTPAPAPPPITEDVRSLTFQQALPRLAQLSDDPAVVSTITKLKHDQDKLERELWAERAAIREKYEDKVKKAKIKATLIGAGLSRHEGQMLTQAYERELKRFDAERVLPAWDGLVTSQQTALAQLRVPTMYSTAVKADRERQQRVIQVLEGIVNQ
ncbi:hypothetical protein C8R46DRAFT_1073987 [Mycena filopes]|nr:hypothetical protein C8R46DRAFT_1073987 [Mycena filopes]